MIFHYLTRRGCQFSCLFVLISLALNLRRLGAQFNLPKNLRVDSEVEIQNGDEIKNYVVEELIDKQEGNILVRVLDSTNSSRRAKDLNYYRIREPSDKIFANDWILSYSKSDSMCKLDSAWQLDELNTFISTLSELNTTSEMLTIKSDRTAIGPAALLQIVQAMAPMLNFNTKAYDEKHLSDMYYFVASFELQDKNLTGKMICSIPPVQDIKEPEATTTLASLSTQAAVYPKSVIVVIMERDSAIVDDDHVNLISYISGKNVKILKRLVANFNLIQERLPSRHMGLKLGSLDERNPFSLPPASGCHVASRDNVFYINARQFSGLFEAKDFKTKRYIAFDGDSHHVRIDSIGQYKMIYDMKRKRQVYIKDSSRQSNHNYGGNSDDDDDDDENRCAQLYLKDSQKNDEFHDIKEAEDVLGVAHYTRLFYLGTTFLEDGSHCVVYEREITVQQIPLINRLTLRVNYLEKDRFFLVYYFIDELAVDNRDPFVLSHETLGLKRIELISKSSIKSKNRILNSQVTFSEFTWSLESASVAMAPASAENPHGRELVFMQHPVRTFDTITCTPARNQIKLEFIITQQQDARKNNSDTMDNEQLDAKFDGGEQEQVQVIDSSFLEDRLEFMEESIMSHLTVQFGLIRSQINELELHSQPGLASSGGGQVTMLIRAKLIEPLKFSWDTQLIGWIYNIDSVPFGRYGTFISSESMVRYECYMRLAAQVGFKKQQQINMLHCPNTGCGYITNLTALQVTKKSSLKEEDWPSIDDNYYLCEVHAQSKHATSPGESEKLTVKSIENLLNGSYTTIRTGYFSGSPATGGSTLDESNSIIRGTISKVLTTVGHANSDSLGVLLKKGTCFTKGTRLNRQVNLSTHFEVIELAFELQHSLVHCHRACQLYAAGCQTYSYDRKDRICTLTNIPKLYLINGDDSTTMTSVDGLREDAANCALYSIDSIHLFDSVHSRIMLNSLNGLCENRKMDCYVTQANLTECANLCHLNHSACHSFDHFPLNNYCLLEDKDSYLYRTLESDATKVVDLNLAAKRATFVNFAGEKDWFSFHESNRYKRNYKQHYAIDHSSMIDAQKMAHKLEVESKGGGEQQNVNNIISLVSGPIFHGLDDEACLRECTIFNPKCIIADHYLDLTIETGSKLVCATYELTRYEQTIISKFGQDPDNSGNKTESGAFKFHSDNSSSSPLHGLESTLSGLVVPKMGSTHYHLAGDNLWLRVKLMMNSNGGQEYQLEPMRDYPEVDGDHVGDMNRHAALITIAGTEAMLVILLLSVGIVSGVLLTAFNISLLATMEQIERIKAALFRIPLEALNMTSRSGTGGTKIKRSQSEIDFVELDDINN